MSAVLCLVSVAINQISFVLPSDGGGLMWYGIHLPWSWEAGRYLRELIGSMTALFGSLFVVWFIRNASRAKRRMAVLFTSRRIGRCRNCGYDLRGGSARCPECGKEPRGGQGDGGINARSR